MAINEKGMRATLEASRPESNQGVRRLWTLVLGDVIVFLVFSFIGRRSHGEETGLQAAGQVIWTALPFLLAWFIIAPFLGAFRREALSDPKKMARKTLQAWVCAWPLGLFLHFLFKQEMPSLSSLISFGLVSLISNSIFLSLWRLPFAFINKKNNR
jgi:hypothetical protein